MPFLKLTRDRRGFEHTYLLHADAPGDRPRILYWYRTAPEVAIGRPALDEDAIRQIEDQHPLIDFDWPAILALRDAMPPEEEGAPQGRDARRDRRSDRRDDWRERSRARSAARAGTGAPMARTTDALTPRSADEDGAGAKPDVAMDDLTGLEAEMSIDAEGLGSDHDVVDEADEYPPSVHGLLEELVGREIATRLRARHAELLARLSAQSFDDHTRAEWMSRADALNPDMWVTPQDILDGVQHADQRFDDLRRRLMGH